jgi:uncharacterized protein (TIRG00374 family)
LSILVNKKSLLEHLRRSEFVVVVSLIVFVVLVVVAASLTGIDAVLAHIRALNPAVLMGLLALSLVNYVARALRWHLFARHLGLDVPLRSNALYYVAGFSMTTTPGKIGEALRLWLLERCHRYGYERVAPLFLGDRLSDMNSMLVLAVLGMLAFDSYRLATLLVALGIVAFTVLFVRPRLLIHLVDLMDTATHHRWPRLIAKGRETLRLTSQLFDWRVYLSTLLLALAGWTAECCAFYWLLQALDAPVSLLQAVFVFSFSMVVGAISMMPGGLGGVEAVMLGLLVGLGTEMDVAIAATAIIRLTTLWFAVGLGFLSLPSALRTARMAPADVKG